MGERILRVSNLMRDTTGLGFGGGVDMAGLELGKATYRDLGEIRVAVTNQIRGNQGVTSEESVVQIELRRVNPRGAGGCHHWSPLPDLRGRDRTTKAGQHKVGVLQVVGEVDRHFSNVGDCFSG
jgi:hypothetical protein